MSQDLLAKFGPKLVWSSHSIWSYSVFIMSKFVHNLFSINSNFFSQSQGSLHLSCARNVILIFAFLAKAVRKWSPTVVAQWDTGFRLMTEYKWSKRHRIYILVGKRKRLYLPIPYCLKNRQTILIGCRRSFKNTNEDGVDRELNFK